MTSATATLSAAERVGPTGPEGRVVARHRSIRSVGAVLAGLLANVILATATDLVLDAVDVFPPLGQPMSDPLYALALAYRCAYGVLAGYLTAWLAPRRPLRHALVLGAIGCALASAGTLAVVASGRDGGLWYALAVIVAAMPTSLLGARLQMQRVARSSAP